MTMVKGLDNWNMVPQGLTGRGAKSSGDKGSGLCVRDKGSELLELRVWGLNGCWFPSTGSPKSEAAALRPSTGT